MCYQTPEHKEAIDAFLEKREPDLRGASDHWSYEIGRAIELSFEEDSVQKTKADRTCPVSWRHSSILFDHMTDYDCPMGTRLSNQYCKRSGSAQGIGTQRLPVQ